MGLSVGALVVGDKVRPSVGAGVGDRVGSVVVGAGLGDGVGPSVGARMGAGVGCVVVGYRFSDGAVDGVGGAAGTVPVSIFPPFPFFAPSVLVSSFASLFAATWEGTLRVLSFGAMSANTAVAKATPWRRRLFVALIKQCVEQS